MLYLAGRGQPSPSSHSAPHTTSLAPGQRGKRSLKMADDEAVFDVLTSAVRLALGAGHTLPTILSKVLEGELLPLGHWVSWQNPHIFLANSAVDSSVREMREAAGEKNMRKRRYKKLKLREATQPPKGSPSDQVAPPVAPLAMREARVTAVAPLPMREPAYYDWGSHHLP